MRLDFAVSHLLGKFFTGGQIAFDGDSVVSAVGNRVSIFDLAAHKCLTLPLEARSDIATVSISPNGALLVVVDVDGHALFINMARRVILHRHNFGARVKTLAWSPDATAFAVTTDSVVHVWRTPVLAKEYSPLALQRRIRAHNDDVTCLAWSPDGLFLASGSEDLTIRITRVGRRQGTRTVTLAGHRDFLVAVFFSEDGYTLYSVSHDGALFVWEWEEASEDGDGEGEAAARRAASLMDKAVAHFGGGGGGEGGSDGITKPLAPDYDTGRWSLAAKHFFNKEEYDAVTTAAFNTDSNLLVVGFASGVFGLYELPAFTKVHALSMSQKYISSVAINATGDWLAIGCAETGSLLVWEWQSETYVLKQQGHGYDVNAVAYAPNGQHLATGGDDGKVKVWSTASGFCFVTFSEHTAPVSALAFAQNGRAVFSASYDGTVRAFDLVRYRNFRTFTSLEDRPTQFSSLAADPSGEVVVAGALDTFEIYIWSVQTGHLLDVIAGHEAPISGLAFSENDGGLVSTSWDGTLRIWDIYTARTTTEVLRHGSDVLCVAVRPDGKQAAAASLRGDISFWDVASGNLLSTIDARRDLRGGRRVGDETAKTNAAATYYFTSLCYSADGSVVIAAGRTKWVCVYEVSQGTLLRKYALSHNRRLGGVLDQLNSARLTEAGVTIDELTDSSSDDDEEAAEARRDVAMPGAQRGAHSKIRNLRPEIRAKSIQFNAAGNAFAVASTIGLLVYSLSEDMVFDPFLLDVDITEDAVADALDAGEYTRALVMSFRLGEHHIVVSSIAAVPPDAIDVVVGALPSLYVKPLLKALAKGLVDQPHVEYYLQWGRATLTAHGTYVKQNASEFESALVLLQRNMSALYDRVRTVSDDVNYTLKVVCDRRPPEPADDAENGGDGTEALA